MAANNKGKVPRVKNKARGYATNLFPIKVSLNCQCSVVTLMWLVQAKQDRQEAEKVSAEHHDFGERETDFKARKAAQGTRGGGQAKEEETGD